MSYRERIKHAIPAEGFGAGQVRQLVAGPWTFSIVLGSRVGEDIEGLLGCEPHEKSLKF